MAIKKAVIIAGGDASGKNLIKTGKCSPDFIICADGGFRHAKNLGITPNLLIGDLDSLTPEEIAFARENNVEVRTFPAEKDESDLELALEAALALLPEEIEILGALGGRFDHTLINVLLLLKYSDTGIPIKIIGENEEILFASRRLVLEEEKGTLISLIPLSSEVKDISLDGFYYPLHHENLLQGSSRGLSNVLVKPPGIIEHSTGLLLVVVNKPGHFSGENSC